MITLTVLLTLTIIGATSAASPTSMDLTISPSSSVNTGQSVTLTATLHDSANNGLLNNQNIDFYEDGVKLGTSKTDGQGIATWTYIPSQGTHTILANYTGGKLGNTNYDPSSATRTLIVNPASKSPTTLTVDPASGTKGSTVTLRARLTSGSTVVPGKNVVFRVSGSTTGMGPVSFDGNYYTCSYTISQSRGTYTNSITAEFAEDSNYYGSNGANTLNILNSNPIANNDYVKVTQNSYVDIDVSSLLANDTDVDGDMLHFIGITQMPTYGPLVQVGPTTYRYTNVGYMGTDSFKYQITDGFGGTAIGTVFVNVNRVPIAVNDAFSVNEDSTLTGVNVAGNDITGDGTNTWHLVSGPSHGTLTFNSDGSFTYTPTANYNGQDSFTYYISDADENSNTATVTITVNPVNDNPVANPDFITTDEDIPITINPLANDSDVDGDSFYLGGYTSPSHGTWSPFSTGTYTYTPFPNYHGTDSFYYAIMDGKGGQGGWVLVTITINPVNDVPVAVNDAFSVAEDGTLTGVSVAGNDITGDGTNTWHLVSGPSHGTLTFNSDGSFTYTPTANFNGLDSFTYRITDADENSNVATVSLTVTPVNDAPIAYDDNIPTSEDTPVPIINVIGNDQDVDGDGLTVTGITPALNGVSSYIGGIVSYTPNSNWFGTDSFQYTISDGKGGTSTATVYINVVPVNDAPTVGNYDVTTDEDTPTGGTVVGNDLDSTLTYSLGTPAAHGTVVVNPDGTWTYTPSKDYTGPDSFTVTVSDGLLTATSTVSITVNPVNDAPIAVDNSVTTSEDSASGYDVLGNDYDVDGDSLTITGVTQPTNGVVVNYGTYVEYTPTSNFNGMDSFTYTISDGKGGTATATVHVTVNPVNDSPVAVDNTATTKEDIPVNGSLAGTDIDGDSLIFAQGTGPSHGTVIVNADGTYTYTPNANYYGSDSFTFIVNDGNGGTDEGTVNITVERAVASIYVLTTVSKNKPTVGETITITFKLGNKGPDAADDVVFTYVIPEGIEFVSLETEPGYPEAVYDPATRTITWTLGTVPVLDPWLKVNLKVLKAGNFNINPTVTTSTYDPTLENSIQTATINSVNVANAASNTSSTVGMQETGVPFAGLILAILAVFAGLISKRK